jgi:dipeptidyl aminopeptidase/acylaminoacyl peptidase
MRILLLATAIAVLIPAPVRAADENATKFGVRESIRSMSLSPDGTRVAYIQPITGKESALLVASVEGGVSKAITSSAGSALNLNWCGWASNTRLVCELFGSSNLSGTLLGFTRLIAINADGTNIKSLSQQGGSGDALNILQFEGTIVSWNVNDSNEVLMSRTYVPERTIGTHLANSDEGLGVDRVDTLTLKSSRVEAPRLNGQTYMADAVGKIRIMSVDEIRSSGLLNGVTHYYYRDAANRAWKTFSTTSEAKRGMQPVAVDSAQNIAYAFGPNDGRQALFKVSLDDSLTSTLVLAHDKVDVDELLTLGRSGRVIGATLVTDKRETLIFDPDLKALSVRLAKALPGLPLIQFVAASRDEHRLLLFAGSDTDPGRYYVFDKPTKKLLEIALARPQLEGATLAAVKPVTYPTGDGVAIPGYLTLPPGSDGKGLPALVLPHGGPSARDEWGFDWLAQYFAAQGFAVLQPNFRGSSGYGNDWYAQNGFKSWRTAIGDVNDAGRWLIKQGIADPGRLAVFGWSYGGYAALQSSALDPTLFKAIVAVAPVTDLGMLIEESRGFTNAQIVADFVGTGDHVRSGSPRQHAADVKAPVLMFSGDKDLNVNVAQARAMDSALRKAGKSTELIIYPGLDHQLDDSAARADMLTRANLFFRKAWPAPAK